jgi:hypothetical protein
MAQLSISIAVETDVSQNKLALFSNSEGRLAMSESIQFQK